MGRAEAAQEIKTIVQDQIKSKKARELESRLEKINVGFYHFNFYRNQELKDQKDTPDAKK